MEWLYDIENFSPALDFAIVAWTEQKSLEGPVK